MQIEFGFTPDFPPFFNYNTNPTGFSALVSQAGQYTVLDNRVVAEGDILGTSNSTAFGMDLPAAPETTFTQVGETYQVGDNGVGLLTVGLVFASSGVAVSLYKEQSLSGWTNSGDKRAVFKVSYFLLQ